MGTERQLLNRREAAARLRIGLKTLYTLTRDRLTAVRLGGRLLYDVADLDRFVDECKTHPGARPEPAGQLCGAE